MQQTGGPNTSQLVLSHRFNLETSLTLTLVSTPF